MFSYSTDDTNKKHRIAKYEYKLNIKKEEKLSRWIIAECSLYKINKADSE